jgi:hypothetical protein
MAPCLHPGHGEACSPANHLFPSRLHSPNTVCRSSEWKLTAAPSPDPGSKSAGARSRQSERSASIDLHVRCILKQVVVTHEKSDYNIQHSSTNNLPTPSSNANSFQLPIRRKSRLGCLGCLWQVGLVLVLGMVLIIALTGLFYPWAFYLGGKFHILPYWQGWGALHAKSGDYVLWIQFEPTPRGSRIIPRFNLQGTGYLCTPRGAQLRMHLGGSMRPHPNLSTDGEKIDLYMNYWPALTGQFISDRRPSLEFRGHWQNPDLVMDDHGSIFRSFTPDGTVYRSHDPNRPYNGEVVPIVFKQGAYSEFKAACAASHK